MFVENNSQHLTGPRIVADLPERIENTDVRAIGSKQPVSAETNLVSPHGRRYQGTTNQPHLHERRIQQRDRSSTVRVD